MPRISSDLEFLLYNTSDFRFFHQPSHSRPGYFYALRVQFFGNCRTPVALFTMLVNSTYLLCKTLVLNACIGRTAL